MQSELSPFSNGRLVIISIMIIITLRQGLVLEAD